MQVFQTAGVPPRYGSSILPIIGCTKNSSAALMKSVIANRGSKSRPRSQANEADADL